MAKKSPQPLDHPAPGKAGTKKVGRPPSVKALKFAWYREIEGFKNCSVDPWWDAIEWDEELRASKAKRSIKPKVISRRVMHAGFLWEAVRRLPNFLELLAGYRRLSGKDPVPDGLPEGRLEFVKFMKKNGMPVVVALETQKGIHLESVWRTGESRGNRYIKFRLSTGRSSGARSRLH